MQKLINIVLMVTLLTMTDVPFVLLAVVPTALAKHLTLTETYLYCTQISVSFGTRSPMIR